MLQSSEALLLLNYSCFSQHLRLSRNVGVYSEERKGKKKKVLKIKPFKNINRRPNLYS